jgi:predicted ATPase/class 3 adenylate cyclase
VSQAGTSALTFLFTDVEGSTRLWEAAPSSMREDLANHDRLLSEAITGNGGTVFKFRGDGVAAVFGRPTDGVAAAVAAQRSLTSARWEVGALRVRMGLHSGEAQQRDGDWFGPTVNRTARLNDVAHGGQIVLSGATAGLVGDHLPTGVSLLDLGEHRLRDLVEPEHIHQVVAADLDQRFSPLRTEHHPSRGVPAPTGRLLGRAVERRRLDELVRAHRLVTITGPPGGGKSRLAVELARDDRDAWPGGVWFCSMAPGGSGPATSVGVAQRLADLLGSAVADGGTPLDAVVGALSERRALVVLDGCDHVLADAAAVAEALRDRCSQTAVLITSRERLGIPDERLLDLPTLGDDAAAALFCERASAVRADFDPVGHGDAVRSLITRLDGLPLAIELAAARVRTHQPAEIDRLLGEHVRVLHTPGRRPVDGQHDLDAAIAWSYDLLDPSEQHAFRRLGLFAGAWTPSDLVPRLDGLDELACTDLLDGLVERSLVALAPPRAADRTSRYRLLSTLRGFARARLDEEADAAEVWRRHRALVIDAVRASAERLCGPDEERWVQDLADRWEDLRAVMAHALAEGDVASATAVVASLDHHCTMRGREVGDWGEAALVLPGFWEQPDAAAAAGLTAEGRIRGADFAGATELAGAVVAHAGPDAPETWLAHSSLALSALADGRLEEGLAHQARMRQAAKAAEGRDPLASAVAAFMTGTVQAYAGAYADAQVSADRVAAVAAATGCPSIEAMASNAQGRAVLAQDKGRAAALFRRSLELATSVTNSVLAAQARWSLAEVATDDDPQGALRTLLDLLGELQTPRDAAHGQQTLLRTIAPLLAVGADEVALLATAALDIPAWDTTVLHRVAKERVLARVDAHAWAAAVDRATALGLVAVRAEVTAAIGDLVG